MAITTRDGVIAGLAQSRPEVIEKASLSFQAAGQYASLWRASGIPATGAIPAAAALCTGALLGAIPFTPQTGGVLSYLGGASITNVNVNSNHSVVDRLAHMGGLNGTLTTAQTVGVDLLTLAVPSTRLGNANYSSVVWFVEWYTATGATVASLTANVTFDDGSVGNLAAVALPATVAAGRTYMLVSNVAGRYIRGVNTITLSASTATAGSFGVTAVRFLAELPSWVAYKTEVYEWAQLGLQEAAQGACLALMVLCSTTSSGVVRGNLRVIAG